MYICNSFFMLATLSNTQLNYQRIGTNKNAPYVLLFLHEALGSIGQWKTFPEHLCERLQLPGIVYERQGHGASDPLIVPRDAQYLHKYALKELPAFLEAIEEKRPVFLVGHSDGGTIALLFASAYPSRVKAMVTMAAHVINEPETIAGIAPAVDAYKAGKLNGLRKYHGDKTETLFFAWADIWRSPSFVHWDITGAIKGYQGAGLFLQGADDQYGTPTQLELIEANHIGSGTSLLLDNCGHHPHLEQESAVIDAIATFTSTL